MTTPCRIAHLAATGLLSLSILQGQVVVPFGGTQSIPAYSFNTGVVVFVRQPANTYSQVQFPFKIPTSTGAILNSYRSLAHAVSSGVSVTMSGPIAPANVGPASQFLAGGDFYGDGTPAAAQSHFSSPERIFIYEATASFGMRNYFSIVIGPQVAGVTSGDFNHDGKADLAVAYSGNGSKAGGVSILISKGDGTFQNPVSYSAGKAPISVATLDLNHDGVLDLAVADNGTPGAVLVLLGKGDGTFGTAASYPLSGAGTSVTIADCNGDGIPDLAVTSINDTISIFAGKGDGTFRAAQTSATGHQPLYIAAADMNKDGKMDLVTAQPYVQNISVLLGKGDGTFQLKSTYYTSYLPETLILTDFNHDGNIDVVGALGDDRGFGPSADSGNIDIALGNGDGTLQGTQGFISASTFSPFLAAADFNGDGKLDALLSDLYSGKIFLFNGAGGGTFQPAVQLTQLSALNGQAGPQAAAVGDFNGDGKPDVAFALSFSNSVGLMMNGAGGLQVSTPFGSGGSSPDAIVTADFNGDGKLDLAVANSSSSNGTTPNLAIFTGGGNGAFVAGKTYPAGLQPASIAAADLNGDGKPDLVVADRGSYTASTFNSGAVYVYINDGTGAFRTPVKYTASDQPHNLTIGDVNGDGKLDLLVSSEDQNFGFKVAILLGKGDGTFQPASLIATDFGPEGIAARDFDGDGKVDLVVAHCCGDTDLTFAKGIGDGTFLPEVHFNGGPSPESIVATDFNGDGKPDILVLGENGNMAALLNTSLPAAVTLNWATGGATVAPNSIASIYGGDLANSTATSGTPPTSLGGTSATIVDSAGTASSIGLYYVSASQLNVAIPAGVATGAATVTVTSGDGVISRGTVQVAAVSPGLAAAGASLLNAYAVHYDSQGNEVGRVQTVSVGSSGNLIATPIIMDPQSQSVYLLLFGTGIRGAALSQVSVQIGTTKITPAYAGPQGQYPGMDQLNVALPYSLKGAGDVTLTVTAAGQTSNVVHLNIQ